MSLLCILVIISLIAITTMYILNLYDLRFFIILIFLVIAIGGYNGYMIYNLNAPSKLSSMIASHNQITPEPLIKKDESCTVLLTPTSSDSLYRLIYTGADSRPDIELKHFPFIFGKNDTCDATLSDPTISRIHAKIDQHSSGLGLPQLIIEDLNSTNGTFINNTPVAPYNKTTISPGDIISFGSITYMLR